MARAEDLFARLEHEAGSYVQELVDTQKSEEAFLEFKRSADDGGGKWLHDNDSKNLADALSGFGNANGGVVVWGVDARASGVGPLESHLIENPARFASLIDNAVSGRTIPPVPGVRSMPLRINEGPSGVVATLIPESPHAPHQSTNGYKYLIRAGSSFVPIQHSVLAGMFGRRPQALVEPRLLLHQFRVDDSVPSKRLGVVAGTFMITNHSSVVAYDPFLSVMCKSKGGGGTRFQLRPAGAHWHATSISNQDISCISSPENRLAPSGSTRVVDMLVMFAQPISSAFKLAITCGCSGSPPYRQLYEVPEGNLHEELQKAFVTWDDSFIKPQRDWHTQSARLMGVAAHWDKES